MKRQTIFLSLICVAVCSASSAGPGKLPEQGLALTVYNDNFAVVRDSRQIAFEQGINTLKFTDVASAIDPTSVTFQCLSSLGAVSILEQSYEYDLVNTYSLLKRYIDRNVTLVLKGSGADAGREFSGILSAAVDNNLILRHGPEIKIIDKDSIEEISLKELPDDLVTKPTLVWLANAKEKANLLCQVSYITGEINWKADYSAVLDVDETKIDFAGWVTIDNKSGATYKDAIIKLIAGDVRRIVKPPRIYPQIMAMDKARALGAGFEEKPFMEYHLYTLGRKSTIVSDQVKQIEFIEPALAVPTKKLYIYERSQKKNKIQIKLEFENTTESNLGIALPKGRVRVFKKDPADGMLEFVGEDKIDHTPKKEKLSLYIGNAFDIVPEYTLLDSKRSRRMSRQKHKIELRNRKEEAVTVFVDEKFPSRVNWKIDESTHKHKRRDARTARFKVRLGVDSTTIIEYTATQTW